MNELLGNIRTIVRKSLLLSYTVLFVSDHTYHVFSISSKSSFNRYIGSVLPSIWIKMGTKESIDLFRSNVDTIETTYKKTGRNRFFFIFKEEIEEILAFRSCFCAVVGKTIEFTHLTRIVVNTAHLDRQRIPTSLVYPRTIEVLKPTRLFTYSSQPTLLPAFMLSSCFSSIQ